MIPRDAVCIIRSDDRLLSNCHNAPVYVCLGELLGTPDDWSQKIDRYCNRCEAKVTVEECHDGPGTEFHKRFGMTETSDKSPESSPEGTT